MRKYTVLWCVLCIAVVLGLFVIKHRVQGLEDRLHALNAEILLDRDATQVLEAEWSYLNQPARLETLSRKLLGMEEPSEKQIVTLREFHLHMTPALKESANFTKASPAEKPAIKPSNQTKPKRTQPKREEYEWLAPILAKMKKEQ
ncbi:MAG: hypothetical protein CFH41_01949 [Alphaproteobacteria bacterium MarineAlpha11_Bin1]|nr:MAG: hypothetical protein CFH41_01949 [Alphaproteobacteria bacterium MarineAlpha11_Bin1]|tara:strand:+ start:13577 stop:14011 length:435 start_codon:yes stop_codon:yes gene_type:complete